jgi:four helix bundle protein
LRGGMGQWLATYEGGVARLMTAQLLNCSTAVPAMLEDARAAESKRDFISKSSIALRKRASHT